MGVKGLQTFLKENRQSLCRTLVLDRDGAASRDRIPVVVDAWGVIYQLYLDSLPWTAGGEYLRFYLITRELVAAWRSVGLEPTFVFDGPSPPSKLETLLQRMSKQISTARVFYSLSNKTRSAPTFSNKGDTILPPFCRSAFAAAVESTGVATHFVPMGEADGVVVALADKIGGYVLGKDTDFMILSAGCERMRGYAPLDMLEWIDSAPPTEGAEASASGGGAGGGDFQTVAVKRTRSARSRLLPPTGAGNPTLVLATFSTSALCRRLRLDAPLLPLLSSLVGNDYTPPWAAEAMFPRMRPGDRIDRVARVLAELRPSVTNAEELVRRAVRKLWARPFIDEAELKSLVDDIIDATIQYVLPAPPCCSVFPFCGDLDAGCRTASTSRVTSRTTTPGPVQASDHKTHPGAHSDAAVAYAAMQRTGHLNALASVYLHPDRVHLWSALEDPSTPSNRAAEAACRARLAAYTIMDNAVGLRFPAASDEIKDEMRQDEEANVLLGVEAQEEETEERPRVVTEYMRQGSSSRIIARRSVLPPKPGSKEGGFKAEAEAGAAAGEEVGSAEDGGKEAQPEGNDSTDNNGKEVKSEENASVADGSKETIPECLLPLSERQKLYLHHLGADTPAILSLPARLHPLLGAIRLILASGGDWTKRELEAVLRGAIGSLAAWDAVGASVASTSSAPTSSSDPNPTSFRPPPQSPTASPSTSSTALERTQSNASEAHSASFDFDAGSVIAPELTTRNTHIVASLTSALQDSHPLAQALLLPDTHTNPHVWICGSALHSLLSGRDPPTGAGWVWNAGCRSRWRKAVAALMDGADFNDVPRDAGEKKKARKKNKAKKKLEESQNGVKTPKGGVTNRFDLLSGI